jgi:hypothetical protein
MNEVPSKFPARRRFLAELGSGAAAAALGAGLLGSGKAFGQEVRIPGFEQARDYESDKAWEPVSDRKIRVGIVGYGVCRFGAAFGFQDHPNVHIVAVSDLIPDRCQALAEAVRCEKTYPSLEELVKDDAIEAVFVATDAPSHARHCLEVLQHGKHVAMAVPAFWGEEFEAADRLLEAVKTTGRNYMMFETSCYHADLYAMRQIYRAGGFGEIVYSEGEYYHYIPDRFPSFREWRPGCPPLWYPTHSTAYHIGVTGGSFTEVSCMGMPSIVPHLMPDGRDGLPGADKRVSTAEASAAAADDGRGRSRRLPRPAVQRIRDLDSGVAQALDRYCHVAEHDGSGRHRPSLGAEERRIDEDPAIRVRVTAQRDLQNRRPSVSRFDAVEDSRPARISVQVPNSR